jgi:transcription factor WhiB
MREPGASSKAFSAAGVFVPRPGNANEIKLLRPRWMSESACRGRGLARWSMAAGVERAEGPGATRRVCAGCRVRAMCLDYALVVGLPGLWGGARA